MDSVSSRWPVLLYFFVAWMIFGAESNFPAIEFSIGKRPAPGPTVVAVPTPLTATPAVTALSAPPPAAGTPASSATAPASSAAASADGVTAAITNNASGAPPELSAGRSGAESPELLALRLAEEEFSRGLGPSQKATIIPRPELDAAQSCQPPPPDRLASRDWSRGFEDGWPAGLQYPRLPVSNDPRVARYIGYFTGTAEGRKTFATWLRRSGKYRDVFAGILEQRRLPTDLAAVAFVESGLWPTAVSKAGATGLWQFMPQTARAYGLEVHDEFDERRSIWRSTEAAADHLKDLFQRFGSWELALAAYNMGYRRLGRALHNAGTEDFWVVSNVSGSLPRETTLYVPKVLAVAIVLNNLSYFSFDDVEPMAALNATPIEVPAGVELSAVARATGTTLQQLREFNPQLPNEVTPNVGRRISIYVPRVATNSTLPGARRDASAAPGPFRELFGAAPAQPAPQSLPGQPNGQAGWLRRLDSTDPALPGEREALPPLLSLPRREENLSRPLELGSVPTAPSAAAATAELDWISWGRPESSLTSGLERGRAAAPAQATTLQYRVVGGDTLWSIAKTHGVTETQIANDNHLLDAALLNVGQLLVLRSATSIAQ